MKKVFYLGVSLAILFTSCSQDEETGIEVSFTASVTGAAPNAQLILANTTTGADSYEWTFSEGASIEVSTDKQPASVTVDKAGELTITLAAFSGDQETTLTKTVTVAGNNAIVSYTDIEFGLNVGDATYGKLFSFETGQVYTDDEVSSVEASSIHLAFGNIGSVMYYFESPTVDTYGLSGATEIQVMNYIEEDMFSVDDFDALTDESGLSGLTIASDDQSFGNSSIPGIVLFELASGQKGAIKTKAVNADRLLVDIKIQKY